MNIVATAGRLTATSIQAATDTTVVITGTQNVDLGSSANQFKHVDASGLTGTLTIELDDTAKQVTGGTAVDTITTKASTDGVLTIATGAGNDDITLTSFGDGTAVDSGDGDDAIKIQGDVSSAVVLGGAGTDTFTVGTNSAVTDTDSILIGGDGTDTLVINATNAVVNLADNANFAFSGFEVLEITSTNAVTLSATDLANNATLSLKGSSAALTIAGADGSANTVDTSLVSFASGQSGTITLVGGTKADAMTGGKANEIFVDDQGADTIDGGTGTDTLSVTGTTIGTDKDTTTVGAEAIDGYVVNMGSTGISAASVYANTGKYLSGGLSSVGSGTTAYLFASDLTANASTQDSFTNIDNVTGSAGKDYIVGSSSDNTINGGDEIDYIKAGSGDDTILGGDGNDTIFGDDGSDSITGGAGNDLMTAGAGADTILFGNASGNDTITLGTSGSATDGSADLVRWNFSTAASLTVTDNVKTINGFEAGSGSDVIQFVQGLLVTSAGTTATTTDGFGTFASGAFSNAASWTAVASNKVFFEVAGTSDVAAGSGTDASLVWAAIGTDVTTSVVSTAKILFAVDDGTDTFLWYFNSTGGNTVAAAADITLIGILKGVNDVATGDFAIV